MPFSTNPKVQIVDASGDPCDGDAGAIKVTLGNGAVVACNSYAEITVGTSAFQLSSSDGINAIMATSEIILQAQFENTGYIMVGDDGVTAASNGIRFNAGDTISLPVGHTTLLYLRASTSGQKINVLVLN